jgi:hypothetical protein
MDCQIMKNLEVNQEQYRPQLFRLTNADEEAAVESLIEKGAIVETVDAMPEAVEDLFKITHPYIAPNSPEFKKSYQRYLERYCDGLTLEDTGVWVYYPWRASLVHLPEADDYQKLRTARNKFLITPEEQELFYGATIGIGGLSVGSSVLNSIVLSGGGSQLRLADLDTLAITNLNRLLGSVTDLTRKKAINAARRAYEIDPFLDITLFTEGLTAENMDDFFRKQGKKLDLFIEEMDDIKLKIDSRFKARELQIPVIMATDNGDNALLDIERFDLEPDRPLFHGKIDESILRNIPANPNQAQRVKLASTIVGHDITPRTQTSLTLVGSKLPSWPQLGNAATLSGVVVSYVARRLLSGQPVPSGRYAVDLDAALDPDFHGDAAVAQRAMQTEDFAQSLELLFGKDIL